MNWATLQIVQRDFCVVRRGDFQVSLNGSIEGLPGIYPVGLDILVRVHPIREARDHIRLDAGLLQGGVCPRSPVPASVPVSAGVDGADMMPAEGLQLVLVQLGGHGGDGPGVPLGLEESGVKDSLHEDDGGPRSSARSPPVPA